MHLNWRQRLESSKEYQNINNWPYIDPQVLTKDKRKKYSRNRKIIASILNGATLTEVSKKHQVSASLVNYLLNRSLAGDEDEPPELTTALIPGALRKTSLRSAPLSRCDHSKGCRGSFQLLLKTVPGLEDRLDKMLTAFVKRKPYSQNITPQIFHKEFLRILREQNWPHDQYPFDRVQLAYESCRKYFQKRIKELRVKPRSPKRAIISKITNKLPFDEIQIDAQTLDINCSIHIDVNGVLHPLRISRLSLYLVKDVATDCNLSYQLCFTQHPNQQDVTDALVGIYNEWKPKMLKTPGLKYADAACLPSSLGENFRSLNINMVRMDNALCHLAHSIRELVCNKLNATLNFGLPGQPKGRNYIEYGIAVLSKEIHRFESTTGSGPLSPIKEKNSGNKKTPVITVDALEEVLSVLITGHNIKQQSRLRGLSPLQLLSLYNTEHYLNYGFNLINEFSGKHYKQKIVNVRWIKSENRRPHINFEYLRYTGDCLSAKECIKQKVIVEYDESDIRQLRVLSINGKVLGTVVAPRTWQQYSHSVRTRKAIIKLTKRERLLGSDLLSGYFHYLLINKHLPKIATELIRIYREYGGISFDFEKPNSVSRDDHSANNTKNRSIGLKPRIPAWSPELESMPATRG